MYLQLPRPHEMEIRTYLLKCGVTQRQLDAVTLHRQGDNVIIHGSKTILLQLAQLITHEDLGVVMRKLDLS